MNAFLVIRLTGLVPCEEAPSERIYPRCENLEEEVEESGFPWFIRGLNLCLIPV